MRTRSITILLCLLVASLGTGCGLFLLVGGAGTSAIAFATGELRSMEASSLAAVDAACESAINTLGYDEIEKTSQPGNIRWKAVTASRDPVDIHLVEKKPEQTELRIRIGVFGDEARSRLVLEQIHQSL